MNISKHTYIYYIVVFPFHVRAEDQRKYLISLQLITNDSLSSILECLSNSFSPLNIYKMIMLYINNISCANYSIHYAYSCNQISWLGMRASQMGRDQCFDFELNFSLSLSKLIHLPMFFIIVKIVHE